MWTWKGNAWFGHIVEIYLYIRVHLVLLVLRVNLVAQVLMVLWGRMAHLEWMVLLESPAGMECLEHLACL